MTKMIELQTCEHCSKDFNIESMCSMEGCWFCSGCLEDFREHFKTCDHNWSPYVNEMGDEGQYCERCCGFVRNEDFPLLFDAPPPEHRPSTDDRPHESNCE